MAEQPKETKPPAAAAAQDTAPQAAADKGKQTKQAEDSAPRAAARAEQNKSKASGKRRLFGLPLLAAGLGGGFIILAACAALLLGGGRQAGQNSAPPASAAQQAAAKPAAEQVTEARREARLKPQAETGQSETAGAEAADWRALQRQVQALSEKQALLRQESAAAAHAVSGLAAQLAAALRQNSEILAKTDALRQEAARIYETRRQERRRLAQLSAAQNLQAALFSGAPYAAQLQLFDAAFPGIWQQAAGAGGAQGGAALIERWQETGLPDNAVLAAGFAPLADRLAAAEEEETPQARTKAGFWQKAAHWLSPWVQIRPQGQARGESPAARLARIEAALTRGESQAALAEAAALPPKMQSAVCAYLAPLAARRAANAAFARAAAAIFPPQAAGAAESSAAPAPKGGN